MNKFFKYLLITILISPVLSFASAFNIPDKTNIKPTKNTYLQIGATVYAQKFDNTVNINTGKYGSEYRPYYNLKLGVNIDRLALFIDGEHFSIDNVATKSHMSNKIESYKVIYNWITFGAKYALIHTDKLNISPIIQGVYEKFRYELNANNSNLNNIVSKIPSSFYPAAGIEIDYKLGEYFTISGSAVASYLKGKTIDANVKLLCFLVRKPKFDLIIMPGIRLYKEDSVNSMDFNPNNNITASLGLAIRLK